MKLYGFVMAMVGIVLFVASALLTNPTIRGIQFDIGALLIGVSAALISIPVLASIYQMIGGEPIANKISRLMGMQQTSSKLYHFGVVDFEGARGLFKIEGIHQNFSQGKHAFISSRNFSAIKHPQVKDLLKDMLRDNKEIRVLIGSDSTRKAEIKTFRDQLPQSLQKRLQIRERKHFMCGMYGNDNCIYVTVPLHKYTGDESPAFFCVKSDSKYDSLYTICVEEFEHVWNNSEQMTA